MTSQCGDVPECGAISHTTSYASGTGHSQASVIELSDRDKQVIKETSKIRFEDQEELCELAEAGGTYGVQY